MSVLSELDSIISFVEKKVPSVDDDDDKKMEEKRLFKTIEVVDVDPTITSSSKIAEWPPQLENIGLADIHRKFIAECSTQKNKLLISKLRTIWMINSTSTGGGVAEMLPMLISMFSEVNVNIKWIVISPSKKYESSFFSLTKQMHNNIHGSFDNKTMTELGDKERECLEAVCSDCFDEFVTLIKPNDIIVVHDPQPLAMIKFIKLNCKNLVIWRSHIGVDDNNDVTAKTWLFLKPYITLADHIIFSMKDYIPKYIINDNKIPYSIIRPAICPFTPKNIGLTTNELLNILSKSNIINTECDEKYKYLVTRVNGKTGQLSDCSNLNNKNLELLINPILCEISRWDSLKGWNELIQAFVFIKENISNSQNSENIKFLKSMILVLGGPDPKFIQDDPEGVKVFNDLCTFYSKLSPEIQSKIYILSLPMHNTQENALIVNAIQRLSSIVIQNSIREGFGLTVTEAMYKGIPMIASGVGGINAQVFHKKNGIIIKNAKDYKSVANAINTMIGSGNIQMKKYGVAAKESVIKNFLLWNQCINYLNVFGQHV